MLRSALYYRLKPFTPRAVRMAVRRWVCQRKRTQVGHIWPICPGSEKPPLGWQGWPDGKQFAFVITHDVEGPVGLANCRKLMELEMELGFRSSFNFIPAGRYRVPDDLRADLVKNGFEVGVHDYHHDGHLYSSRKHFLKCAEGINRTLREWGAVGYRSGFMLRNLDWIHDLDIAYDSSTFDTDPFEPQPQGVHTIFPFWVPRPASPRSPISDLRTPNSDPPAGYLELPYTLPQDSTLFLLLRERTPAVWLQKLEWVARHGGMALVNVHPDYLSFDGRAASLRTFPVRCYRDFLTSVRGAHRDQFWNVRPKDVAAWAASAPGIAPGASKAGPLPPASLKGKRAAVLLYSYYPSDPRPRREAEALVAAGMQVDLVCLREKPDEPREETAGGVRVRRVPLRKRRDGKLTYLLQYGTFLAASAALLARWTFRGRYDLVHVHNMPDILVFSALPAKVRGAKVILDLHDPMPELMMSIFGLRESSLAVRVLRGLERLSIGFADHVITVNLACKKIFGRRSCRPEKIQVLMNAPDEGIFGFEAGQRPPPSVGRRPYAIMYHGSIVERHGLDLAVAALEKIRATVPTACLKVYGSRNAFLDSVLRQATEKGLGDAVHYLGPKSLEEIVQAIDECDLGIIPNRRSIFTELNTPTRIFEYLSRGKPVIAPDAPGITDYFGREELIYFKLGDAEDLARQILFAHESNGRVQEIVARGQAVYLRHRWSQERTEFLDRVASLLGG